MLTIYNVKDKYKKAAESIISETFIFDSHAGNIDEVSRFHINHMNPMYSQSCT